MEIKNDVDGYSKCTIRVCFRKQLKPKALDHERSETKPAGIRRIRAAVSQEAQL